MKKFKSFYASACVALAVVFSSCSAMSNMSSEDAYNVGYGLGTLIRNM